MENFSGVKVKEEGDSGPGRWSEEFQRMEQARSRLRDSAARMASEAGMAAGSKSKSRAEHPRSGGGADCDCKNVNHGGAHSTWPSVKTPKYGGKSDWEAFHAQFELLAHAGEWTEREKALQLAMCLTDDALKCLLLVSPEDRHDYGALVAALKRRFGQCVQPGLLKNELSNRYRLPGETLRALANDIESLTRQAYAHMPPDVQSELARDQFIRALSPTELRVQVQLEHPRSLQAALELAVEREFVWGVPAGGSHSESMPITRVAVGTNDGLEKPAWASELTELIRAMSIQSTRTPHTSPRVCWGCGQPGHFLRQCPKAPRGPGNDPGSA